MSFAKRRRKKERDTEPYVRLARYMLFDSKEWKDLSPAAKLLYLHIKAKYNGSNNEKIRLSYSELKGNTGISSPKTISNAQKELIKKGWIERAKYGGLYRYSNLYKLTWKYDCLT